MDWCRKSDVGLPAPDVIIYLNMPLEVVESRGEYEEERYERRDMQVRVRQRFATLKQADESSALPSSRWCDIDAAYCCTWRSICDGECSMARAARENLRKSGGMRPD